MNLREAALAIAKRLPHALILEHGDPVFLVRSAGKGVISIPEFKVQRGFILGEESEAPICHPPLSEQELLIATAMAVENYWHRLHGQLSDVPDENLRTFITVSPDLDPETVCVGVYVFVAVPL